MIGLTPIMAALFVPAASNLPECCRRAGKHHCSTPAANPDGPSVVSARCGSFPTAGFVAVSPVAESIPSSAAGTQVFARFSLRRQSGFALCGDSVAPPQRGPPSSLLIV